MVFEKQQISSNILCALVIYCVLWSYLHSKEIDENRNRIIRITGLTFSENIRHVNDPVGHQRRMRACGLQKYLTRIDTLINYLAMIKRWDINFSWVSANMRIEYSMKKHNEIWRKSPNLSNL